MFEFDSKSDAKDKDVFHFVSYVPIDGRLYELDGLREGPVDHGAIPDGSDWIDTVRPIIEQRMASYQSGEIHFNLMAIIPDKVMKFKKLLEAAQVSKKATSLTLVIIPFSHFLLNFEYVNLT